MINAVGRDIPEEILEMTGKEVFQGNHYRDGYVYKKDGPYTKCVVNNTQSKLVANIHDVLVKCGIKDGMTLGFHHHFREGDYIVNMVMEEVHKMGIKDITICASSLGKAHDPIVPYIEDGTITNTLSADNGLASIASTGVQAMMRRSDLVLAKSVADRTMIAGERRSGNMWVDVTGEHYKADDLENGGSFKSDMGYGTFGFDMPFSRDSFLGAAYQYNKGKLKSSHSDIKNKIDGNGFSLYAGTNFGDFRLVADAAYLKNTNDITASQTALTQECDAKIYSLGLRGQYRLTLGTFEIIPSIGARVSRLETEAMRVGSIAIDKQKQNLYQFPMALQLAGFTTKLGTWFVAPKLIVSYVPTLGDKEISILGLDQTVIDTQPLQGSFGLRAVKGRTMWNIDLTAGTGNDGVETHGGRISMKFRW
mgnify:CR=1 FL=1